MVNVPFAIFGTSYALVGVVMLVLYFFDPTNVTQAAPGKEEEKGATNKAFFEVKIVGHLILFILILVAVENQIAQMLGVYSITNKELTFDEHTSAYLLADYWASFTTGRVIAIVMAFKLMPYTILVISNTVCVTGTTILLLFGMSHNWALWLSIGILGFGLAPCYGAAMSWAVRYVKLRYVHMTLVLVASCAGQMIPPLTVGWKIGENPRVFVYAIAGFMIVHTINVSLMYVSTRGASEKSEKPVETVPATDMVDVPEI